MYLAPGEPKRLIEFHRQALHAFRLEFQHPVTHRWLKFEAELPEDFTRLLEELRTAREQNKRK